MSKISSVLECQDGYKIRWKIDNFKYIPKTDSTNSPQILESCHFTMWDCNWKFEIILKEVLEFGWIRVYLSLEVLDVKSWDEKRLTISATLKALCTHGMDSKSKDFQHNQMQNGYKINFGDFDVYPTFERIRSDLELTWTIWQEVSSARFKRQTLNSKRTQFMANKWGLMLDDTADHNVKIRCQGVEVTAHKEILSGSSSVFKAMFQADMKETRESQVEVTVRSPEAVKVMLRWIYGSTGDIEEKESHALDLLKLAHYYDLEGLMEECQLILVDTLCKENVIQILNEAELLGAKELKDSAIQFIIRNKADFKEEDLGTKLKPQLLVQLFLAH